MEKITEKIKIISGTEETLKRKYLIRQKRYNKKNDKTIAEYAAIKPFEKIGTIIINEDRNKKRYLFLYTMEK